MGYVIQEEQGNVVRAACKRYEYAYSVLEMELRAILEAVKRFGHVHDQKITIFTDSTQAASLVGKKKEWRGVESFLVREEEEMELGSVKMIEDCKSFFWFHTSPISHCSASNTTIASSTSPISFHHRTAALSSASTIRSHYHRGTATETYPPQPQPPNLLRHHHSSAGGRDYGKVSQGIEPPFPRVSAFRFLGDRLLFISYPLYSDAHMKRESESCESCGTSIAPNLSRKSHNSPAGTNHLCTACARLKKMKHHCGICKKIRNQSDNGTWVRCNGCNQEMLAP